MAYGVAPTRSIVSEINLTYVKPFFGTIQDENVIHKFSVHLLGIPFPNPVLNLVTENVFNGYHPDQSATFWNAVTLSDSEQSYSKYLLPFTCRLSIIIHFCLV